MTLPREPVDPDALVALSERWGLDSALNRLLSALRGVTHAPLRRTAATQHLGWDGRSSDHVPDVLNGRWQQGDRVALRERLAGKHLLITGVTGFVGEALLERLMGDLPDTRLLVLIRPRSGPERPRSAGTPAAEAGLRRAARDAPPSRSSLARRRGRRGRPCGRPRAARRPRPGRALRRRGVVRPADRRGLRHQSRRPPRGTARRSRGHQRPLPSCRRSTSSTCPPLTSPGLRSGLGRRGRRPPQRRLEGRGSRRSCASARTPRMPHAPPRR